MNPSNILIPGILVILITGSTFYLLRTLKHDRQFTFIHGPQHIPDYFLFNRLVSDTGFAGRWVLTVYVFISAGFFISIYLLARNLITKFNNKKTDENL